MKKQDLSRRTLSRQPGSYAYMAQNFVTSFVNQGSLPCVVAPRKLSKFVATAAAIRHAGIAWGTTEKKNAAFGRWAGEGARGVLMFSMR